MTHASEVIIGPDGVARCPWADSTDDYRTYHDSEWGRPVHGDVALFERISLEAFQSGLSWITILRKRQGFRSAFCGFDPHAVAEFGDDDLARLMDDAGIVRNRRKVEATIANARALVALQDAGRSLDDLFWSFAPSPRPRPVRLAEVPSATAASRALSVELKRNGFAFVGPTTMYAAMQACGVVDDHLRDCGVAAEVSR